MRSNVEEIPVSDPKVPASRRGALSEQSMVILTAFKKRPFLTTADLHAMGFIDYNARITDCRNAGWDIERFAGEEETGLFYYRLNNKESKKAMKVFMVPALVRVPGLAPVEIDLPVKAVSWDRAKWKARFAVKVRALEDLEDYRNAD